MNKMHPDFETRMLWKEQTGLPMNISIDDGLAFEVQKLHFKQIAFQMDTNDKFNKDKWNAIGLNGQLCDSDIGELSENDLEELRNFVKNNKYALENISDNKIFSDQVYDYLIMGGEKATNSIIEGLNLKVDELRKSNDLVF